MIASPYMIQLPPPCENAIDALSREQRGGKIANPGTDPVEWTEVDRIDSLFCPIKDPLRCISDVRDQVIHTRLRRIDCVPRPLSQQFQFLRDRRARLHNVSYVLVDVTGFLIHAMFSSGYRAIEPLLIFCRNVACLRIPEGRLQKKHFEQESQSAPRCLPVDCPQVRTGPPSWPLPHAGCFSLPLRQR